MAPKITLHQFVFSNFCEKVRWACDIKGVTPTLKTYLPFLHMKPIKALSGQTSVPVMEYEGTVVAGSAASVATLENLFPETPLLPKDPKSREAVLNWEARLDAIGPTVRGAMFYDFTTDRPFMFRVLTSGYSGRLFMYRQMFRMMFPRMKSMLKERVPDREALYVSVGALLDDIDAATQNTGYLVGERFTLADLAAASILYPLIFPEGTPGAEQINTAEAGRTWLGRWAEHGATDYVLRMYSEHRH